MPEIPALDSLDRWSAGIAAAWILAPALLAWMYFGTSGRMAELEVQVEKARADSARYAAVIQTSEQLRAQRDTIAQKLQIIQEIDAGRYTWPHILDEVSRALPEYTWLEGLTQVQSGPEPEFTIEGFTGNNFALTRFMRDLEASPFLRGIRLASTELVNQGDETVHNFVLNASFEMPPADLIETVPLFGEEE